MDKRSQMLHAVVRALQAAEIGWAGTAANVALQTIEAFDGGCVVVPKVMTEDMVMELSGLQSDMWTATDIAKEYWPDIIAASPYAPKEP